MLIDTITVTNFGSWYGTQVVRMAGAGLTLVEGRNYDASGADSNGSGKSTLFDALDWCLFGKQRGDYAEDVISRGCDAAMVVVRLVDHDQVVEVDRSRTKKGPSLVVRFGPKDGDLQELQTLDVAETQRRLEGMLGLDRTIFHAAVLFGQTDRWDFAEATQSERMDILTRILGLEELDAMLEVAKAQVTEQTIAISASRERREALAGNLGTVLSLLQEVRNNQVRWRGTERERLSQQIQELEAYCTTIRGALEADGTPEQVQALIDQHAQAKPLEAKPTPEQEAELHQLQLAQDRLDAEGLPKMGAGADLEELQTTIYAHTLEKPSAPTSKDREQDPRYSELLASMAALEASGPTPSGSLDVDASTTQAAQDARLVVSIAQGAMDAQTAVVQGLGSLDVGTCSTCHQPVTGEYLIAERALAQKKLEDLCRAYEETRQVAQLAEAALATECQRVEAVKADLEKQRVFHKEEWARLSKLRSAMESDFEQEHIRRMAAWEDAHNALLYKLREVEQAAQIAYNQRCQARTEEQERIRGARDRVLHQVNQAYSQQLNLWQTESNRLGDLLRCQQTAQGYLQQSLTALDGLRAQLAGVDTAATPYDTQLPGLEAQANDLDASVTEAGVQVEERTRKLEYLSFVADALRPNGLRSYILDSRLGELTASANRWVRALTDDTMSLQFVSQVATKSKTVKNAVDFRVFRYESGEVVERSYRSWSGGERQRISLGIDFGLAEMVARRARKGWQVLILDELFRHLDRTGKQSVVAMLRGMLETKDSIYVVEHDADFRDQFDRRVEVQKREGRSLWTNVIGGTHYEPFSLNEGGTGESHGVQEQSVVEPSDPKPKTKARRSRVPVRSPVRGKA